MSYIIEPNENFEEGIKRIIIDKTREAIEALKNNDDNHKGIHEARQVFKIIRSAWRLVRFELGEDAFKIRNGFYRDEGRRLAVMRDMTAVLETLEFLHQEFADSMDAGLQESIKEMAIEKRRDIMYSSGSLVRIVAAWLELFSGEVNDFHPAKHLNKNVLKGITLVYKRGYFAFLINYHQPTAWQMHEWRKRAKYLRYQYHILRNYRPPSFEEKEMKLHHLTDYLGDYNNIEVFRRFVKTNTRIGHIAEKYLMEICDSSQERLHKEAIFEGIQIYADTPLEFYKRMSSILNVS